MRAPQAGSVWGGGSGSFHPSHQELKVAIPPEMSYSIPFFSLPFRGSVLATRGHTALHLTSHLWSRLFLQSSCLYSQEC